MPDSGAERTRTWQAVQSQVLGLALSQQGLVSRGQLLRLGLTPGVIRARQKTGHLLRVHQGVYALGRPPRTPLEQAAAAVLACGEDAFLSHGSALALWELAPWPRRSHVTVAGNRSRPGIAIHRCRTLLRRDIRHRHGIPVSGLARTLLDTAPELPDRRLTRLVNDALRTPHLSRSMLDELLARVPTHPGARRLRRFAQRTASNPTRSALEDEFLRFCAAHGLPQPLTNTIVCGYEADAYFPRHRLVVEVDGYAFHRDRDAFESDRDRDADMLAAGVATVRVTRDRLRGQPRAEASRLRHILVRRQPQEPPM